MSSYTLTYRGAEYSVRFTNSISSFEASSNGSTVSSPEILSVLYEAARKLYLMQEADILGVQEDTRNGVAALSRVATAEVQLEAYAAALKVTALVSLGPAGAVTAATSLKVLVDPIAVGNITSHVLTATLAQIYATQARDDVQALISDLPVLVNPSLSGIPIDVENVNEAWDTFDNIIGYWSGMSSLLGRVDPPGWLGAFWSLTGPLLGATGAVGRAVDARTVEALGNLFGAVVDLIDAGGDIRSNLEELWRTYITGEIGGLHLGNVRFPNSTAFETDALADADGGGGLVTTSTISRVYDGPDLAVIEFTIETPEIVSGDTVRVGVTLVNQGDLAASNIVTSLYLSRDSIASSDDISLGAINIDRLAVNQSVTFDLERVTADWGAGTYYVYAATDINAAYYPGQGGRIQETNEVNNIGGFHAVTFSDAIGGTDDSPESANTVNTADFAANASTAATLAVGGTLMSTIGEAGDTDWIAVDLVAGETYTISLDGAAVGEIGALEDTFFRIRNEDGIPLEPTRPVDDTSYGNANGQNAELDFTPTTSGIFYISVGAGGVDGVYQYLTGGYSLSVVGEGSAGLADLVITDFDINGRRFDQLADIPLDITVFNAGQASAEYVEVKFYLSLSGMLDGTEIYIGRTSNGSSGLGAFEDWTTDRNPDIPAGVPAGDYVVLAVVDPDRDVVEGAGEANNIVSGGTITIHGPRGADLEFLDGPDLSDNTLRTGDTVRVSYVVENDGDADAESSEVHFYLSSDVEYDPEVDIYLGREGLGPMDIDEQDPESEEVDIPWHIEAGNYYILSVLDALDEVVGERSNDNVEATAIIIEQSAQPDYDITAIDITYLDPPISDGLIFPGQDVRVQFTVDNIGQGDTERDVNGNRPAIGLYVSTDPFFSSDDVFVGSDTTSVDAGGSDARGETITLPVGIPAGDYYLIGVADPDDMFPEEREENNVSTPMRITIAEGSGFGPDPQLTNISLSSSSFTPNDALTVTWSNSNHGDTEAAVYVAFFVTHSAVFNANDVILTEGSTTSPNPGSEQVRSDFVTLPRDLALGRYYVHLAVDPFGSAAEANELNNTYEAVSFVVSDISLMDGPIGTRNSDTLYGSGVNDALNGRGGDDVLHGAEGHDALLAGQGNDALFGGTGADTLYGEDGDDELWGDSSTDLLFGDAGDDTLTGGTGADTLYGGSGNDSILSNTGVDVIYGGDGDDWISPGNGVDIAYGDAGDDTIIGRTGWDTIYGGAGDDRLFGSEGRDALHGNEDNDYVSGGSGFDTLWGGQGNDTLFGNKGEDDLNGGLGNDTLYGATGDDRLNGGSGNDELYGAQGRDTLEGGEGNDFLRGGTLGDMFIFDVGHDHDIISGLEWLDQIHLSLDLTGGLTDASEILTTFQTNVDGKVGLDFGNGDRILFDSALPLPELQAVLYTF